MKRLNKQLICLTLLMFCSMFPIAALATEPLALNEIATTYEERLYNSSKHSSTTSSHLQQLPENIIGCSNLYECLIPEKGYYTATKYDTSNGAVLSVVIPVEPGDRIASSSFDAVSKNMGAVDGIRVTYLLGDKIVISLPASEVYNKYTSDGYITVPDGVDAACIPWWVSSDSNWLTLSQISKDFAVHIPQTVSAIEPTCTESGYTAGEVCEICNASLGEREEIPPTGHTYSEDICTICGAINLSEILSGKYVSILGDSISTFNGYTNDATVNTTIGVNGPRYDAGTADTKPGSYCLLESVNQTWWMDFANRNSMKLLVNNSWAGSQVFGGQTSDGRVIPAAYLNRCVNLHDNTLENNYENAPIYPDVIFVYLGINDYNFNRSKVGTGAVDYAGLVNTDGTYVTPSSFGEAYGIMLHKMQNTYPDAQIFAMTLLPENLYSVDKTAWEQHNAYIRTAAEYYDIPVVDLAENCAITWENYSGYMIDKIHPTTTGMKLISDCIEDELLIYYKKNRTHTHTYENGLCTGCGTSQPAPIIIQQPTNDEAKLGDCYCITVEAEGEGLTYTWYGRNTDSKDWFMLTVTGNTYTDVMTNDSANREVYCVITDTNGNSITTNIAKLILLPSEESDNDSQSPGGSTSGSISGGGGGGIPTKPVIITTSEEHINLHKESVEVDVWGAAASAIQEDKNAKVIISTNSSVNISATAEKSHEKITTFNKPITIIMPIGGDVLKTTKDKSKLTMALVTTDAKGNTTVEYIGGYYDSKEDTFTAYTNKPGNYILVEKSDIVKIDLFIDNHTVVINNDTVMNDVAPSIMNKRTMVPVAFVLHYLNCQVLWDGDNRMVNITLPDARKLSMTIDKELPGFGAAPVIKSDRTLVPIGYVAGVMGAHVLWVENDQRVIIVK